MQTRILTGIVMALAAVPVIVWSGTPLLTVVIAALSVIGVFEMLKCLGVHQNYLLSIPSYLAALAVPFLVRFLPVGEKWFILFVSGYLYILYVLACAMFSRGKIRFPDAAKVIVSTVYIVCGFSALIALRSLKHGTYLLLMAIVVAFATDIFAYFSGMLFGKHKLIPTVSPKKTVEGAIGGTLISALAFVGSGVLYANLYEAGRPHIMALFACGIALSVVAQIGDLIASFIKRESGIKDYGSLFPGHGGVLDRFDSVIAVAPVLYMLLAYPSIFTIFR